jgi:hypothetical protein
MSTASSLVPSPAHVPRAARVVIGDNVAIPAEVTGLESICRWAISEQRRERGRFSYLRGTIPHAKRADMARLA